jgi:CxC6 like cysteine cluster associated with KDZ transposases
VSVVVIDGVTIGHPCCGEPNCKIPLENNHHRFCPIHSSLNQQCAIIGCLSPTASGNKTCSLVDHQAVERVHNDRGQARFQLKERLRRAQIAHPSDALPVEGVVDISELVEDANIDDNFTSNHRGVQYCVIYSKN